MKKEKLRQKKEEIPELVLADFDTLPDDWTLPDENADNADWIKKGGDEFFNITIKTRAREFSNISIKNGGFCRARLENPYICTV